MTSCRSQALVSLLVGLMLGCSSHPEPARRTAEPGALLEALVQAWDSHDSAAVDTLMDPLAIHEDLALGFRGEGRDKIRAFMRQTFEMIPDFDWRPSNILTDGSEAAAEWTLAGTYSGETPQGPVKNRRFSIRGASVVVTDHGKIIRFSDYYNLTEFYRQVMTKPAK
jgi:steroid delta-isomerase-like uncharacterized protein